MYVCIHMRTMFVYRCGCMQIFVDIHMLMNKDVHLCACKYGYRAFAHITGWVLNTNI